MEKNTFRVIEIVNDKKILINYGSKHGIKEGDKVQIYSIGRKVVDPLSKQSLGTWDLIKDTLTVMQAFESFSVCSKEVTRNIFMPIPTLNTLSTLSSTSIDSLDVDKNEITNDDVKGDRIIKVGDLVRKI